MPTATQCWVRGATVAGAMLACASGLLHGATGPDCPVQLTPDNTWGRHAWPDADRVRRDTAVALGPGSERGVAEITYVFGSAKATQVHVDVPVSIPKVFRHVSFDVQGDGTANELEFWINGLGGKWYKQGTNVALGSRGWVTVHRQVDGTPTDVVQRARWVIGRKGGAGKGTVRLRRLVFHDPLPGPPPKLGHVFDPVPPGLPYLPRAKPFAVERRRVGDRTVLLVDGDPLFCVLDAQLDPAFLRSARESGVNTFALPLYWRDLEPRPTYNDWDRLQARVQAFGRCGFALILLVNIHQPAWLVRELSGEPRDPAMGTVYPNAPRVRGTFSEFLREFVRRTAGYPNVIAYGLSAGGEADGDFHEVNGQAHPWRRSPSLLADFRARLGRTYGSTPALRTAWKDDRVTLETAVPVPPLGPYDKPWRDTRPAAHDWHAFVDRFWVSTIEWQARVVKQTAPQKMTLVRLSWPVFQMADPMLARHAADWLDLLQVKDAVPTWEQATPVYLRSRVALFHAATRGTDVVNFPEVDVGHNRGEATSADIVRFLSAVAEFSGGVWYYRDVKPDQWPGIKAAAAQVKKTVLATRPGPDRRVAVFYGQRYANWVQNHAEYHNEDSLAGCVRALDALGVPFDIVSDSCLADLGRYRILIVPDGHYMPRAAAAAIGAFVARGGRALAETHVAALDIRGRALEPAWKQRVRLLPHGSLRRLRPKEEGITLTPAGRATIQRIREFLHP